MLNYPMMFNQTNLISARSQDAGLTHSNIESAKAVGKLIAEKALAGWCYS